MANDPLSDFTRSDVSELGRTKPVYRLGDAGPCVVIVHEIPTVTPTVANFARHVAAQGFQVSLPVLTGTAGQEPKPLALVKAVAQVCISKEMSLFAGGKSSPVVDWLRAFGRHEHERCGGPGIGVVGMCFSGGFALAMAVDDHVLAPVMSQPSVPARLPLRPFTPRSIDVSDADIDAVRERLDADADLCVLAYRFADDKLVPEERFAFLRERLGERFVHTTFPSEPKNAHSVLTEHLVESARNEVLQMFTRQLLHRRPDDPRPPKIG
jgi:dienelactone hydrolase